MVGKLITFSTLLILLMTSCAVPPGTQIGTSAGACAGAVLGIITNDLQVIGIEPKSAADQAGVQVGDTLIDLTLVEAGPAQPCNDVINLGPDGSPLPTPRGAISAPRDTSHFPKEPVPFTDRDNIRELTDYNVLLRLRVRRDGPLMELMIEPQAPGAGYTPGDPTATPIPMTGNLDYF